MRVGYGTCVKSIVGLSLLFCGAMAFAQDTASLSGQVTDPSAASIPEATVTLESEASIRVEQKTNAEGRYSFTNLAPGKYTLRASKPGFGQFEMLDVEVAGTAKLDFGMVVTMEAQKVTVEGESRNVGVDPNSNAGALVLTGKDLETLSDDPDQLSQDLAALAGPSAGPNGGQIYIDGFTGGRLPPKSSIREIRINQNPFSAEFDRLGFGRIEIFTKPGTDKFRGQVMTMFSDNVLNARNPFVSERPDFRSRMIVGTISGPVTKKSSFSFDIENRAVDESAVVNARVLDENLQVVPYTASIPAPQMRWNIVPRYDYQLNGKNSLTARYAYSKVRDQDQGVGNFNLPSRAYDNLDSEHSVQLTETAILSSRAINETRVQFMRTNTSQTGDGTTPTLQVLDSFTNGGSSLGLSGVTNNRWELQNMTSLNMGKHAWKFGGRVRTSNLTDRADQNFAGTYTFTGGRLGPMLDALGEIVSGADGNPVLIPIDSLESYRRTEWGLENGLTAAQIRALGGGAAQFMLSGGNPVTSVSQVDLGVFALDDWRVRPNFTLSYGLRYETQTNIHDYSDISPRLSFAWGLGRQSGRQAATVIRGGFGIFYDRVSDNLTLQSARYNGQTQQQYIVMNPEFYPVVPSLDQLASNLVPQTMRQVAGDLRAPYIMQTAFGIDRQLPHSTALSVNYTFSRGLHMLRTRNLPTDASTGVAASNIYYYESSGTMRQQQLMTNLNTRFAKRFSVFGFYMLNFAKSDTDGVGSFPVDSYNYSDEWGSSGFDTRHRLFLGGSVSAPWKLTLSPFITANSGAPVNLITGIDNNHDTIINDRPAFASALGKDVVSTPWGLFNINPQAGDTIVPRNYARGPSQFSINLRLSRTWGFGTRGESGPGSNWTPPGMGRGGPGGGGPGGGGPGGGGPPPGGGGGRGGPGGGGGPFGEASTGKRFNLTLGISARNLLNTVNLGQPIGNLSSPLAGESTSLAGGFGPMGSSASSNRRIDLQLRFSF